MGFIIMIIVGGLIGWIAGMIMGKDIPGGILGNIIAGLIGSFIGSKLLGTWSCLGRSTNLPSINRCNYSYFIVSLILKAIKNKYSI